MKLPIIVASCIGGSVLAAALLVGVNNAVENVKCDAYGDETGRDTRFRFLVGCMVKTSTGWLPREEIRQVTRTNP